MDLTREDARLVLVHHTRLSFDPRPEGLLDAWWLEEVGGGDVVTFSQWSDSQWSDSRRWDSVGVTGERAYRRYRSGGPATPDREVGCVVLVSVEFDRPGVAEEWVDLVFTALDAEEEPHPGGISAHFHVSTDGLRVLNYAEWTSAEAHQDAMARGGGSVGLSEPWRRVQSFTGLRNSDVRRYRAALR